MESHAIKEIKDSAPGENNVRISQIRHAVREVKKQITKLVQFMFDNNAETWEESLKTGDMVPIYKKGNKEISSNYRGVVLLAMASRIVARVMAVRLRWWSEELGLVDDNQAGFREGKSTADAITNMENRRLKSSVEHMKRSGWKIVMISEMKSKDTGVIWMGEAEELVAVIQDQKSGIALMGNSLTE